MRTTIRLDDDLLAQVKLAAARSGKSMTAVIEDALREMLARQQHRRGSAIVVASHDALPAPGWAHRRVELAGGALIDG